MKKLKLVLISFLITCNIMAGGVGGSSGGGTVDPIKPHMILNLDDLRFSDGQFREIIKKIDNIEIDNEIRFPNSDLEKFKLLKKPSVQSIQLKDGDIIKINEMVNLKGGVGGSSGGTVIP